MTDNLIFEGELWWMEPWDEYYDNLDSIGILVKLTEEQRDMIRALDGGKFKMTLERIRDDHT